MGSMHFHCGALLLRHYCLCHSDSASVLLYLIVSSLLTIVPFAVRGWYLSYVLYPWGERIHYTTNLYLQVTDIAGIHSCTRYAYSSSAFGFLGVSVGPSLYTVVCTTVIVHQFFWMYLYYVLLHILVELVVQFPARGSTQSVIMPFSWCVVAVTLPI